MQRPEVISVPELRQFGFALAVLVVLLFVGLLPWVRDAARPLWPWIVSAALGLAAGLAPATLRPVYRGWFPIALALAWFNTRFLLGIVFFALMTPLGTVLRALGKLQYTERWDERSDSYRSNVSHQARTEDLERPY
ncbi:MAG: SxtJ family membrane protein [Chromatiales bacterium]|jgi:hypothetical protein|nr:SxtJ family membrane protein [Chromatiales bacterium]MDH3933283.1 SxtJ family membrane protein [Chromatiales bacterium]PLX54944.1 MAG: hypothetical protein C0629_15055 [Chromatiales bacterium]